MRLFNERVFSKQISGTTIWYTDAIYNDMLGAAEYLALQCIIEQASGGVNFSIDTQWSNDGSTWVTRSSQVVAAKGFTGGVQLFVEPATATGGAFCRLAIYLSAAGGVGDLTIIACGRAQQSWA